MAGQNEIYFDACCINRLTDDQAQARILREADAVEKLIGVANSESNVWVGSVVLETEISRNPDREWRQDAETLLSFTREVVKLDGRIIARARELEMAGFSEFDALHLACAEGAKSDVLLTTDDRLLRRANGLQTKLSVRVLNPVSFLEEIQDANPRNV